MIDDKETALRYAEKFNNGTAREVTDREEFLAAVKKLELDDDYWDVSRIFSFAYEYGKRGYFCRENYDVAYIYDDTLIAMNKLEDELKKTGYCYRDNEDGSYNVEYNGYAVTVSEDEEDWCLNYIKTPEGNILPYSEEEYDENFLMGADTGTSYYPKNDYTLESALENLISKSDK